MLLPRVHSEHGVHRALSVGLATVGGLFLKCKTFVDVGLFPMSVVGEQYWEAEASHLHEFLGSGRLDCIGGRVCMLLPARRLSLALPAALRQLPPTPMQYYREAEKCFHCCAPSGAYNGLTEESPQLS